MLSYRKALPEKPASSLSSIRGPIPSAGRDFSIDAGVDLSYKQQNRNKGGNSAWRKI